MTYTKLIERLRRAYTGTLRADAHDAADAIEALQATVTVREGQANHWQEVAQEAQAERDALQAKLDELAKQEPVGVFDFAVNEETAAIRYEYEKHKLASGTKLYAAPEAKQ